MKREETTKKIIHLIHTLDGIHGKHNVDFDRVEEIFTIKNRGQVRKLAWYSKEAPYSIQFRKKTIVTPCLAGDMVDEEIKIDDLSITDLESVHLSLKKLFEMYSEMVFDNEVEEETLKLMKKFGRL